MKTLTVEEAQTQLGRLIAEANRGDVIVLTDGALPSCRSLIHPPEKPSQTKPTAMPDTCTPTCR